MEWVKLGDIATFVNGYAFKSQKYTDSGIRIIRISNVQKGYIDDANPKYYSEQDMLSLEKYYLNESDILISLTGNVGRVALISKEMLPAALNQRVGCIRPIDEVDSLYLFSILNSNTFELFCINKSKGIAQKNLGTKELLNIMIPIPKLDIQKKVSSILCKSQLLIDKRKKQIALLDKLTESIFYEMFGDPIKNEKGWEVMKLSCASECLVPARDKPKSFTGSIPWITINDLVPSGYTKLSKNGMGLTIEEIRNVKRKTIPVGCVLMSCVGDIGITSINSIEVVINQQIHAFNCKENLNSIYLKYYIPKRVDYFSRASNSTTVKYLNKTKCENIPLLLPPEFALKVEKIEVQKELLEQSLKLMEDNYNNLMQRAFKGELFDTNIC